MDIRKIRKLIELINETGVGEIEVKSGEDSVRISRFASGQVTTAALPSAPLATPPLSPTQASVPQETISSEPTGEPTSADPGSQITSPMVGTVYLSASPGSKPFVEVGQVIKKGDTLCIIEAMKMFNKIESDKAGKISARLVENGQPVEYDQPLFIIDEHE